MEPQEAFYEDIVRNIYRFIIEDSLSLASKLLTLSSKHRRIALEEYMKLYGNKPLDYKEVNELYTSANVFSYALFDGSITRFDIDERNHFCGLFVSSEGGKSPYNCVMRVYIHRLIQLVARTAAPIAIDFNIYIDETRTLDASIALEKITLDSPKRDLLKDTETDFETRMFNWEDGGHFWRRGGWNPEVSIDILNTYRMARTRTLFMEFNPLYARNYTVQLLRTLYYYAKETVFDVERLTFIYIYFYLSARVLNLQLDDICIINDDVLFNPVYEAEFGKEPLLYRLRSRSNYQYVDYNVYLERVRSELDKLYTLLVGAVNALP